MIGFRMHFNKWILKVTFCVWFSTNHYTQSKYARSWPFGRLHWNICFLFGTSIHKFSLLSMQSNCFIFLFFCKNAPLHHHNFSINLGNVACVKSHYNALQTLKYIMYAHGMGWYKECVSINMTAAMLISSYLRFMVSPAYCSSQLAYHSKTFWLGRYKN